MAHEFDYEYYVQELQDYVGINITEYERYVAPKLTGHPDTWHPAEGGDISFTVHDTVTGEEVSDAVAELVDEDEVYRMHVDTLNEQGELYYDNDDYYDDTLPY